MVIDAQGVLAERGVPDRTVHTELFHVEAEPAPPRAAADEPVRGGRHRHDPRSTAGSRRSRWPRDERVLDAALRVRGELPYACKGGVCSHLPGARSSRAR